MREYHAEEWPHGLRCLDCDRPFIEGQPIAERLVAMFELDDDVRQSATAVVEIVCVACDLGAAG